MGQRHRTGMSHCKRVVTHWGPHRDERIAYWLAWKWGEINFPGFRDAEIIFLKTAGLFEGKTWQQHWHEDTLLLGTGGEGPFNEHPSRSKPRKVGECTATLIAKFLGVDDDPALIPILQETLNDDTQGKILPGWDFSRIVRNANLYGTLTPKESLFMTLHLAEDRYAKELATLACEKDLTALDHAGKVQFIKDSLGRVGVLVRGCENPEMGSFLRKRDAWIILLQNNAGQTQILARTPVAKSILEKIVAAVRTKEATIKGVVKIPDDLTREGEVEGLEEWYYSGQSLLNGSHSYPDTPPTRITFDEFKEIIELSMTTCT